MAKRIIVTGGAGYIGSHVCLELLSADCEILVIDNFDNASPIALERLEALGGKTFVTLEADLANPADKERIYEAVRTFEPDSAVHLAGLKAVGESVENPLKYYQVNVGAAITLIGALDAANARNIVFSSSATVYGDHNQSPVTESAQTGPTNPYGRTKFFIEEMLRDLTRTNADWRICNLRYFNPVGAHPSGKIGEDPNGVPNNLFPFIAQVAVGRRARLQVFGNDYPTTDGTGVRDYIHVVDLARGHRDALEYLATADKAHAIDINLGVGEGISVLQAVAAFKRASNRDIPYDIVERRPGDIAEIYADAAKAKDLLGWRAEKTLEDMCADHWRWQHNNPNGYEE